MINTYIQQKYKFHELDNNEYIQILLTKIIPKFINLITNPEKPT